MSHPSICRTNFVAFIAFAVAVTACSGQSAGDQAAAIPCEDLTVDPDAETAVMILADGRSTAVDRLLDALIEEPQRVFGSDRLGLNEEEAGIVAIALYDDVGEVDVVASFDLGGVGDERVRRAADAGRQADCLAEAAGALPNGEGGHLLRALRTAMPLADSVAARTTIVGAGLGRSSGDGFIVADTELATSQDRDFVRGELQRTGFIAAPPNGSVNLVYLAPGEGIGSGIIAGHVTAFAEELCSADTSDDRCTVQEVLP